MSEFNPFADQEPPRAPRTKMTPEEVVADRIESLRDTPLESTGKPPSPEAIEEAKRLADALAAQRHETVEVGGTEQEWEDALASSAALQGLGLTTAASLVDPDVDPDEGDFEPGMYKGFEIVPPDEWPVVKRHAHIKRRFYVRHNDTFGLVPWAGSQIVWPWEAAWDQNLYREQVTPLLKDEKKEKKRG